LYYVSKELKTELEQCETLEDLDLSNPELSIEKFDRNFDEDKFQDFKESIIEHIDRILLAYEESNEDKSLELWQLVF
jgi:hypothetical protein